MEQSFISDAAIWDRSVALWLRAHLNAAWLDPIMIFISSNWTWIIIVAFVLGKAIWRKQWHVVWFCVGAAIVLGVVDVFCSELLKPSVARLRPCREFPELFQATYRCGGAHSFPSNHAANSMVLAVLVLLNLSRPYGWLLVAFSLLVGLSRIYLGVHYPGDVLMGWFVGTSFAILASLLFRRFGLGQAKGTVDQA